MATGSTDERKTEQAFNIGTVIVRHVRNNTITGKHFEVYVIHFF